LAELVVVPFFERNEGGVPPRNRTPIETGGAHGRWNSINSNRARWNLRNQNPSCTPWPSQLAARDAGKKTTKFSPEIKSWIDNVIVPRLIQKLIHELEQQ
jgi:hypothetical protein